MNKSIKQLFLTLCFSLTALSAQAELQSLDKIVAIVDDDVITQSDVDNKLKQIMSNLNKQKRPMPAEEEIAKQVMDRLILESLQLQLARRAGVHISEEQLTSAIDNIAQRNGVTLQEFRLRLDKDGLDYHQMREQVRRDMTMQQVQQGHLRSNIQISDNDIASFLQSAEGKAMTTTRYHLSHLLLPVDEGSSKAQIKKAEKTLAQLRSDILAKLQRFDSFVQGKSYKKQPISGADLGSRSFDDLPSLFAEVASQMQAGEISKPVRSGAGWHLLKMNNISGTAKVVHQTHARHILIKLSEVRNESQATRQINALYERLQKGEDFTLLAKEYSEDPGSALQGGDLGWSMPGQFVPAFEKTLAALAIDEVSKPFKSQFGWHIMQKLAERDHDMTQDSQKNQAYQALYERRFSEELDSWQLKIRSEAFIELK
ncbi:MAG: peptidylprolyl isomerase [Pseudomonadales bacterium]|nr:peptidylprolyl isomerase [Pseudomonadales bacterium]